MEPEKLIMLRMACLFQGDSGGPLMINRCGRFFQLGITVRGTHCVTNYAKDPGKNAL